MYRDVANYINLEQSNLKYWSNVGQSIGDFMIRFWFRDDFKNVFTYEKIDDCDLTVTDIICPEKG